MSSLFELQNEFQTLYNMMTDPDVDEQVLQDTLEAVMGEFEVKAEGCVYFMKRLEMERDKAKDVANDLLAKAKARDNALNRMKDMILKTMESAQVKKIDAGAFTIAVSKNGGKQPMIIDGDVPDNFKRIIYEDDKELIRKHLEDGEVLNFAKLLPRGEHISIK